MIFKVATNIAINKDFFQLSTDGLLIKKKKGLLHMCAHTDMIFKKLQTH